MSELAHYENPRLWVAERYLGNDAEVRRFETTARMLPPVAGLLDVGAGNGAFLAVMERARAGTALLGYERSQAAIDRKVCEAPVRQGSAEALPFADREWDAVSALEVIEHLPYGVYEQALAEMERVAGRYIVISVPFRENRLLVQCPYCACEFNPHYHMRRYEEADIRGLFRAFRCVEFVTVRTPVPAGYDLMTPAFRWVRRRRGFFPPMSHCPQCGFHAESAPSTPRAGRAAEAAATAARSSAALRAARLARRMLPTVQRPKWGIALFERQPGDGAAPSPRAAE
jgi:Methyltransferase domain